MDSQKKFLGARIETQIMEIVEEIARERNVNKTSAIKILVSAGWKELRLEKALNLYREEKISIDKAAKMAGITVSEMMKEAAMHGIKSEETIEEYKLGLKNLIS